MAGMKRLVAIAAMFFVMAGAGADDFQLQGDWSGALQTPGAILRMQVHIKRDAAGAYSGVMDSIDQGAKGIPVETISLKDDTLLLDVTRVGGRYQGRWNPTRLQWEGTWSQGEANFPLNLARGLLAKPLRPQNPVKPYPYLEEEVRYENPQSGLQLAGTLTLPRTGGPFPVALLISGSGQQDRDETVADHKPFWVIADHLTREGIAVLRVDDRGVGGSQAGDLKNATSADFATDVQAGVAYLRQRPEIDAGKIGLIGHSEGGLIAPMVAAANPAIAWLVLLAAPGVPGDRVLLEQGRMLGQSMGYPPERIDRIAELNEELYDLVKSEPDAAARAEKMRPLMSTIIRESGMPQSVVESQLRLSASPWFYFFLTHDPGAELTKVRCPVLALNGEKDMQIGAKENLAGIRAALADNPDAQTRELPGLNHLFQRARTGAPSEYAQLPETVAPAALTAMSTWILSRMRGRQ